MLTENINYAPGPSSLSPSLSALLHFDLAVFIVNNSHQQSAVYYHAHVVAINNELDNPSSSTWQHQE